jgi:hypothetical protein
VFAKVIKIQTSVCMCTCMNLFSIYISSKRLYFWSITSWEVVVGFFSSSPRGSFQPFNMKYVVCYFFLCASFIRLKVFYQESLLIRISYIIMADHMQWEAIQIRTVLNKVVNIYNSERNIFSKYSSGSPWKIVPWY